MKENAQYACIIAGGLLEKDGKFLLVNARVGAPKGLWNIPAGRVDEGEVVEEAAVREVKEETGLDVRIEGLVNVFHRPTNNVADKNIIRVNFKMKIIGGDFNYPKDEIAEAKWLSVKKIQTMEDSMFASGVKECIMDYIERGCVKQGKFSTKEDVI